MKKIFFIIAAVVAFVVSASAEIGQPQKVVTSGSGECWAAITNNTTCTFTNAIIDCTQQKDVCFQWTAALSNSGTTANTVTIKESCDKQNWETLTAFTMTPAGTTPVTVVTNITVGAAPYLLVYSINNANANTGYITNQTIRVFLK